MIGSYLLKEHDAFRWMKLRMRENFLGCRYYL
jgi:hypothetical protein